MILASTCMRIHPSQDVNHPLVQVVSEDLLNQIREKQPELGDD